MQITIANDRVPIPGADPSKLIARTLSIEATLSVRAFEKLKDTLESFGNVLSERHEAALMRIVGAFSFLATGRKRGRWAFPLDCGGGKSRSVVAWIAALHELHLPYSVAVAASKVEALCDMKRALLEQGVPEASVGLWHGYEYDPAKAKKAKHGDAPGFASEPATTDHDTKQILLVTHSRVRGEKWVEAVNSYRGRPRNLVVWDESLLVTDHRAVSRLDLKSELGWLAPRLESTKTTPAAFEAADYLHECVAILDQELREQEEDSRREPRTLVLPQRDADTVDRYISALAKFNGRTQTLRDFLEISHQRLRVIRAGGGGYVTYTVAVPEQLDRVAVLDASWPIRELEQLDATIQADDKFDGRVKNYSRVTLHIMKTRSGRSAVEESFKAARRQDRLIAREVLEVVKTIPLDEPVLIFTFKKHDGSIDVKELLAEDLRAAAVDVDKRVTILTWGMETSLNEYRHINNVILAGILQRSDMDLAGAIIGQRQDLLSNVNTLDIASIRRSEAAHAAYQALSRGSCRDIEDGEAKPMNGWLIHHDTKLTDVLSKVMPGVVWKRWEAQYVAVSRSKISDTARKIAAYLGELPDSVISTRRLKDEGNFRDVPKRTFSHALREVVALVPWTLNGRSLVRVFGNESTEATPHAIEATATSRVK